MVRPSVATHLESASIELGWPAPSAIGCRNRHRWLVLDRAVRRETRCEWQIRQPTHRPPAIERPRIVWDRHQLAQGGFDHVVLSRQGQGKNAFTIAVVTDLRQDVSFSNNLTKNRRASCRRLAEWRRFATSVVAALTQAGSGVIDQRLDHLVLSRRGYGDHGARVFLGNNTHLSIAFEQVLQCACHRFCGKSVAT